MYYSKVKINKHHPNFLIQKLLFNELKLSVWNPRVSATKTLVDPISSKSNPIQINKQNIFEI
jgi:hypothetical protein